jgi:hypothetical protein
MPQQLLWYTDHKHRQPPRLLLGREALLIQGYPIAKVPQLIAKSTELTMQSIAGNMMVPSIPMAIVLCAMLCMPFAPVSDHDPHDLECSGQDAQDALDLFNLLGQDREEELEQSSQEAKKRKRAFY